MGIFEDLYFMLIFWAFEEAVYVEPREVDMSGGISPTSTISSASTMTVCAASVLCLSDIRCIWEETHTTHDGIEVIARPFEHTVPHLICLRRFDPCEFRHLK